MNEKKLRSATIVPPSETEWGFFHVLFLDLSQLKYWRFLGNISDVYFSDNLFFRFLISGMLLDWIKNLHVLKITIKATISSFSYFIYYNNFLFTLLRIILIISHHTIFKMFKYCTLNVKYITIPYKYSRVQDLHVWLYCHCFSCTFADTKLILYMK